MNYSQIYGRTIETGGDDIKIYTLTDGTGVYTEVIQNGNKITIPLKQPRIERLHNKEELKIFEYHVNEINNVIKKLYGVEEVIKVEDFMSTLLYQILGSWTPHLYIL